MYKIKASTLYYYEPNFEPLIHALYQSALWPALGISLVKTINIKSIYVF